MSERANEIGATTRADLKFAIVVARFNSGITEKLLAGAREALERPKRRVWKFSTFPEPSSFRSQRKCWPTRSATTRSSRLGAVIRGETPHFDYVAGEAARGLQQRGARNRVPVAFGVLTTDTLEQAEARRRAHGTKDTMPP